MNISTLGKVLLRRILCTVVIFLVPPAHAAVYDFALGDAGNRSLRLNLPDSVPVVRGIIIYGNGAGIDARGAATDPELVALATSLECAVMGTAYWAYFSDTIPPTELTGFESGLQQFAQMSGHPEIVYAPWMPSGMSNGGNMSYELNAQRPSKVITFMTNKGGYYSHLRPVAAALATPGVLIAGQLDDDLHHAVIQDLFTGNRPRGALWVALEEEGAGHVTGNAREFFYPYIEAMFRARFPTGASPVNGPVALLAVSEAEGWLTDPDSYKQGLAVIAPYAAYTKDKSVAGWLPNRRLAYIFRAFASYDKATPTATVSTGTGPADWGTAITYTIGQPVAPWTSIDFYEGDVLLKHVTSANGDSLSVDLTPASPGYSVLHALVTFADGTQRTTVPRRVFVRAGPPQAPAIASVPGNATASFGDTVTFSASATGYPAPTCQWRKNGVNLVNGGNISGVTSTTLSITNAQVADAGDYTFVATNAVGSATSNAAALTVNKASATVSLGGLSGTYTGAAHNATATTSPAGLAVTFTYDGSATAPVNAGSYAVAAAVNEANYQGSASGTLVIAKAPLAAKADDQRKVPGTANPALTITHTGFVNGETAAVLATPPTASTTATAGSPAGTYPITLSGGSDNNYALALQDGTLTVTWTPAAGAGESVLSNGFTATWGSLSGATGYRLDVSADSSFGSFVSGFQDLDVGGATSRAVSGLSANTTYYYRIRAYTGAGTGASSNSIATTTSAPVVITTPLIVSTLAGQPLSSGRIDGAGSAARFFYLSGVAADNAGNLYVADTDNHTIRKIVVSTGAVTTLAGAAGSSGRVDGSGSAARFNNPSGVAVDGAGNIYVADTLSHTLRKVTASGVVSTLAGSAGTAGSVDGTGSAARFQGPQGLAIDSGGNLYVADTNNHIIRKVVPATGVVTTLAGLAGNSGNADGLGGLARFAFPSGVAVDGAGNLFVADAENHTIRKILPSGSVNTLAGLAGASGGADGAGSAARFDSPSDVAVDLSGNIYVADTDNHTIRNVVPTTGAVSTLAGLAGTSGSTDGQGSAVRFFHPAGLAVDSSGNLYVADTNNHTVRAGLLPLAPAIQTQPQSQAVTVGANVQFTVTASGRPAVTYQWYFNGTAISGATGNAYNLSSAQAANAGSYTVVVSNVMHSVTSDPATLTVNTSAPLPAPSGGGGGGGAPSTWFCGALLALAAVRALQWRQEWHRSTP